MKRVLLVLFPLICSTPVLAQHLVLKLQSAAFDDSTNAVEIPQFHLRLVYPRLGDNSDTPRLTFDDGINNLFLGNDENRSLQIEFATIQGIITTLDSTRARKLRGEFFSGDERTPETEEEFIHRRTLFQRHLVGDFFESYRDFHGRVYGIKAYYFEPEGPIAEAHTYVDSLQIILRVHFDTYDLSSRVYNFLTKELNLPYSDAQQNFRNVMLSVYKVDLLRLLNRIVFQKE